uniref:Phospholipase/carboxylesterase/thioesterase domain-containing protein n=1 Tax=Octactis speculum TaxID=3111310 RepID=A0A7S2CMJ2_9STRA|mmetsp:Transcript_37741/g.51112  ORF Transcript_37741/g.51112 Transcript_37741/m.51112 type:complete len:109 (+) Transcript_37741:28-354(+)
MALQTAIRCRHRLGAVFAMSSYMSDDSWFYSALADTSRKTNFPPVFMAHGTNDNFIQYSWGESTARQIRELGVPVVFTPVNGAAHEMVPQELESLFRWIKETIPLESP